MSDATLTCPYCDAFIDPAATGGGAQPGRVVCPRCGESFNPTTGFRSDQTAIAPGRESVRGDVPFRESVLDDIVLSPVEKPHARNRPVGLGILGVMAVLFATALTYALVTSSLRRDHDTGRIP